MRLSELHIDGFGKLVNHHFQFAPGFNLIYGVNEAGKSTLQQAIVTMLYGFFGEGRRPKEEERTHWSALKPWNEEAVYQGSLIYTLDSGQSFLVSRTFAPQFNTALMSYPDKVDLSMRFRRADEGRLFFAEEQIGMVKDVFENVCTVHQAELAALDTSAGAVAETLMRLSASASADTKIADAIASLEKTLEVEIGIVNAPTRPLSKARRELAKLERERSELLYARRKLFGQLVELNELEEELEQLELERQRRRYLQILTEISDLQKQLSAVAEADAEVKRWAEELARWEVWDEFPTELRDETVRLGSERGRLQTESE